MANVLLARQDRSMRQYLAEQLQRHGHRVTITDCVDGMMAAINDNNDGFAILISDLGLSGKDGFELVQELEKLAPDMRLIFLSGFSGIGVSQSKGDHFDARIVTHPFHIRELPDKINYMLSDDEAAA